MTREEVANLELGHTTVTRAQAVVLVLGLLGTVLAVPLWQHVHDVKQNLAAWEQAPDARRRWTALLPQVYDIVRLAPSWDEVYRARSWKKAYAALPSSREIELYEDAVEENSVLARLMLPKVQWVQSTLGDTGNQEAVTGRDGWLFYKPGVEYLTAGPFLDEGRLANIARYTELQPDPVKGILHFRDQLAARGITLVVMPTPVKPQVHPARLTGRYAADGPVLQNPSYGGFVDRLRAAGVAVFDPSDVLAAAARETGEPQYLQADTHWTPGAMQRVAGALSAFIRSRVDLPAADPDRFARGETQVTNHGDITVMLKLPDGQQIYKPQTVTIAPVTESIDGDRSPPWRPLPGAPVLLLGDSFTNIYTAPDLNWGQHAGLAEQLSVELGLPVDRIAINAGGSYSAREALAKDLHRHYGVVDKTGAAPARERLADKRVVVYQFANRELLNGDWKLIDLPAARPEHFGPRKPSPQDRRETGDAPPIRVEATVAAVGPQPRRDQPYEDAVVALHLTDIKVLKGDGIDADPPPEDGLLVYGRGMAKRKLTAVAELTPGQRVTLNLRPWDDVQETYGSMQRLDLGTEADFLYPIWWTDLGDPAGP